MTLSRAIAAAVLSAALACAALAHARAATLLHLSDTETVSAAPDELDATLRAQADNASPADAQQRVNAAMAAALARARNVPGITVSTGGYAVWQVGPAPQDRAGHWQATQTLNLTSHDGPALLALAGALQHSGLAIESLNWRLSRDAQRKAHDDALRAAIEALRGKATSAAVLLGLRFGSFRQVTLGLTAPPPMPRFATAMAVAAAIPAATPPSAVSEDVPVTATVEADAILLPK